MHHLRAPLFLILVSVLFGCGGHTGGEHADASHGGDIAWFEGEVEAAFALAAEQNKPLFLYWGAEWCPPCHALKKRVFSHPDFVAKIGEFIPVYLDGDTERAQILGEKFGTHGYPTVLIFNPEAEEIMRLPTDADVPRFVALMDLALRRMQPISRVLQEVLAAGAGAASPGDLNLLAFVEWGSIEALDDGARLEALLGLYRGTPEELAAEKSRFLALYLEEVISPAHEDEEEEEEGAAGPVLSDSEKAGYRDAVLALLADPVQREANLSFLFGAPDEAIRFFHPEPSAGRTELMQAWEAAARQVEADETLSTDNRLRACYPLLALAQLEASPGGESDEPVPLPDDLLSHFRDQVAWAAENVTSDSEMQAVMNTMAHVLEDAGLEGELEALLLENMDDAHAPYYFMGWMGSLKAEAGEVGEALGWYRKAYDSAEGRYTRFRWGSIYLRQVMKLTPEDAATVEDASFEILSELLTLEDAFAGGNQSRLGQLDEAYRSWNEDGAHDGLLTRIARMVHDECGRYPGGEEESQQTRCEAFLAG